MYGPATPYEHMSITTTVVLKAPAQEFADATANPPYLPLAARGSRIRVTQGVGVGPATLTRAAWR
jgi:hypothetical protein